MNLEDISVERDAPSAEQEIFKVFKALGDARRIALLEAVADNPGICACGLLEAFDMSQSTLSHHMKLLCEAGFVACSKSGKWMHYALCCDGMESIRDFLDSLQSRTGDDNAGCDVYGE